MNKNLLYKFFQGFSTELEKKEIRSWMESSDSNKKQFYRERKLFDLLILWKNQESTHKLVIKKKIFQYSWVKEFLKIAAVFLISYVGFNTYYSDFSEHEQDMQTLRIPSGQRINVTLSDGTNVWLNSNSKLSYPAFFSKNERKVYIEGEAFFDVAHNKKKPFVVETFKGCLQVLGTKFNVVADKENGMFSTSLIEGSVRVEVGKQLKILKPGEMVCMKGEKLMIKKIVDYNEFRWKEGLICFRDLSFQRIIEKFEDAFDVKIILQNPLIAKRCFSGKIRVSDGVMSALNVMQTLVDFSIRRDSIDLKIYLK